MLMNPHDKFSAWFKEAIINEEKATAMVLSTVDEKKGVHGRVVLLKDILDGKFVFFTNYNSNKALQIAKDNRVSLNFHWPSLAKQIIISGKAKKIDDDKYNDSYFHSRPFTFQLSAIASKQSQTLKSRDLLLQNFADLKQKHLNKSVDRPKNWGAFAIDPQIFEFWQEREDRLHERHVYTCDSTKKWQVKLLYP